MEYPQTIQDVEAQAAKVGIALTPDDYYAANEVAEQRRIQLENELAQAEQSQSATAQWVDRFNRFYPKFLKALHAIGDVFITLAYTALIAFGVPIVLLFCLIVEHGRVYHGIKLFDSTEALAWLGAFVIVIANLLIELLISWRQHQAGWTAPPQYRFSLRIWAIRLRYMFGQSVDWQPAQKSPAQRFKTMLRIITITILALALAGSMQDASQRTNGDWYTAIGQILLHSTLPEMQAWLGGLAFAFCVVIIAQGLSHFVAERVVEIVAIMQSSAGDKPRLIAEATGTTAAMHMLGRLKAKQTARRRGEIVDQVTPSVLSVSPQTRQDRQTSGALASKKATALALLESDSSLFDLTVRALEEKTGINRSAWSEAKREFKRPMGFAGMVDTAQD